MFQLPCTPTATEKSVKHAPPAPPPEHSCFSHWLAARYSGYIYDSKARMIYYHFCSAGAAAHVSCIARSKTVSEKVMFAGCKFYTFFSCRAHPLQLNKSVTHTHTTPPPPSTPTLPPPPNITFSVTLFRIHLLLDQ